MMPGRDITSRMAHVLKFTLWKLRPRSGNVVFVREKPSKTGGFRKRLLPLDKIQANYSSEQPVAVIADGTGLTGGRSALKNIRQLRTDLNRTIWQLSGMIPHQMQLGFLYSLKHRPKYRKLTCLEAYRTCRISRKRPYKNIISGNGHQQQAQQEKNVFLHS